MNYFIVLLRNSLTRLNTEIPLKTMFIINSQKYTNKHTHQNYGLFCQINQTADQSFIIFRFEYSILQGIINKQLGLWYTTPFL
uniref:Uncharacterized protein n=1 Tax=Schistosoma mansoni TaxID=6183 RepID=A0A5K4F5N1_SCHMA